MRAGIRSTQGRGTGIRLGMAAFIIAAASTLLLVPAAQADIRLPSEYRFSESIAKFDEVSQVALVFDGRPLYRLRAQRTELAIGQLSSLSERHLFVSYGAVWRLPQRWMPVKRGNWFVDFGFSPTWVSGSRFNGRDLGGNIHFTSSVSIGGYLNRRKTIELSLRAQHTSNGGLHRHNPGLDMIGLSIAYRGRSAQ